MAGATVAMTMAIHQTRLHKWGMKMFYPWIMNRKDSETWLIQYIINIQAAHPTQKVKRFSAQKEDISNSAILKFYS